MAHAYVVLLTFCGFCRHSPFEFVRKDFCDISPTLVAQAVVVHVTFVACREGLCRCAHIHHTKHEFRTMRGIVGEGSTSPLRMPLVSWELQFW